MGEVITIGVLLLVFGSAAALITRSNRVQSERYWRRRENRAAPGASRGWAGAAGGGIWGAGHHGDLGGHHGGCGGGHSGCGGGAGCGGCGCGGGGCGGCGGGGCRCRCQIRRSSTAFSNGSAEKIGRHKPETCWAAEAFGTTRGSPTENVRP